MAGLKQRFLDLLGQLPDDDEGVVDADAAASGAEGEGDEVESLKQEIAGLRAQQDHQKEIATLTKEREKLQKEVGAQTSQNSPEVEPEPPVAEGNGAVKVPVAAGTPPPGSRRAVTKLEDMPVESYQNDDTWDDIKTRWRNGEYME